MAYATPELAALYNSRWWKRRRREQLTNYPLCAMCLSQDRIVAATVVDHVVPHRANAELFFDGELQSLCVMHHNKTKQDIERRGFHTRVDINGKPIDPNHPANRHGGHHFLIESTRSKGGAAAFK
jgi:hypothetical protein